MQTFCMNYNFTHIDAHKGTVPQVERHAACRAEGIRHDVADSDRHESNGVIERCNRTVIEGTKCLLFQSGMPHKYWPQAMQTFCMNYNFTHIDAHKGTVPQVERHGAQFAGSPMVFGQRIRYLPSAKREVDEQKKFDARLRDGFFAGYRMHSWCAMDRSVPCI